MLKLDYPWHEVLVHAARSRPELWRLIAGCIGVVTIVFGLIAALQAVLMAIAPDFWIGQMADPSTQGSTAGSLIILLGTFGFLTVGVAVVAQILHGRSPVTVFGPWPVLVSQFVRVFGFLCLLGVALMVLPPYGDTADLEANLPLARWLLLLPVSLTVVLIQTSAEEVFFRGYLQQQLAARFSSPLVWLLVPSALFAVGHYIPAQAGENALMIALWSGVFGVLMADLTARAGTLGPAIAVHFANNLGALLFVSLPDSLNGLSLYTVPFGMDDTVAMSRQLPVEFALLIVCWLVARLAIRR